MIVTLVAIPTALVGACKSNDKGTTDAGPATSVSVYQPRQRSSAPMASNIPVPAASVENVVNPDHAAPYSGPTGVVEGVVKIKGDPNPVVKLELPADCAGARETYGHLFREGPDRTLADAMVAVTEYKGYVPAKDPAIKVNVDKCAFDRLTYVATFGQRLEVFSSDKSNSYVPFLAGVASAAHMVLTPLTPSGVKLYPLDFGRFLMMDEMNRPWMKADVFVLKYSTHAVSGLDGRFRIEGIPVGDVRVSAFLPIIDATESKQVTVEAGKPTGVEFTLEYKRPAPSASASASAPTRKMPVIK